MNVLLSLNVALLLSVFTTIHTSPTEECMSSSAEVMTTMTRICNFTLNTSGNGNCPADAVELLITGNCQARASALVCATNLSSAPIKNAQYSLPSGVPDIYYEYSKNAGPPTIIGPINTFTFNGNYHQNSNGVTYPLFEYDDYMFFDVTDECDQSNFALFDISVRLLTAGGLIYPIHDYSDVGEVFYCDVFLETCNDCNPPPAACNGGSLPIYEFPACGECNDCGGAKGRRNTDDGTDVIVSPNPFDDLITIQYTLDYASEVVVELIDAKGAVVQKIQANQDEGHQKVEVTTNGLQNGVYICRMKIKNEVVINKIIKL